MKMIAIYNNKGGVGKSTTAINVAYILAEVMKKKVLVIDCDGQQNTSRFFADTLPNSGFEQSLLHTEISPLTALCQTRYQGIDVLTSSEAMNTCTEEFSKLSAAAQEYNLAKLCSSFEGQYDYVLLDMPPALNRMTEALLSVTDGVVVPVELGTFSTQGIAKVTDVINKVGTSFLGCFVTKYDKGNKSDAELKALLDSILGNKVFRAVIPYSKTIRNSTNYRMTAYEYMHWLPPVRRYVQLTEEIVRKVG